MASPSTSILLKALENASTLSLTYQAQQRSLLQPLEELDDERIRGTQRKPTSSTRTSGITDQLDEIDSQIEQVRIWLQAHPELLRILDVGIRNEVRAMERRLKWTNVAVNALFTILGAIIGLLLPVLITSIRAW